MDNIQRGASKRRDCTELSLFMELFSHMLTDLCDRGLIPMAACDRFSQRVGRLAAQVGMKVFTTELPKFGKALDALLLVDSLVVAKYNDVHTPHTQLPIITLPEPEKATVLCFFDEFAPLFGGDWTHRVLLDWLNGLLSPQLVRSLRELAYLCYKYDLPADANTHNAAVVQFKDTDASVSSTALGPVEGLRTFVHRIFHRFDPFDIRPRHGPGAVSTKETGPRKYDWTFLTRGLVDCYGYESFVASYTHLAEVLQDLQALPESAGPARLLLVPKDSRGPRVISCEPKEHQWVQQGIMRSMVQWLERHPLTRKSVHFTDQSINASLALRGSQDGSLATLDLSEASDRVGWALVRAIFPEGMVAAFESCRSTVTVLPDGSHVTLQKFAPMGSGLCFPVLATVIYACLRNAGVRGCHVYGDDVIVKKAQALTAIRALEEVGLKVNLSKSCFSNSLFRESCGCDAYKGVEVTPVRIRKRWSNRPRPDTYCAWISYTNSLHQRGYPSAAAMLAHQLVRIYGPIEYGRGEDKLLVPHFCFWLPSLPTPRRRWNPHLFRWEILVRRVVARKTKFDRTDGYQLLEYFSKAASPRRDDVFASRRQADGLVSLYTKRRDVSLVRKWTAEYTIPCEKAHKRLIGEVERIVANGSDAASKESLILWLQRNNLFSFEAA